MSIKLVLVLLAIAAYISWKLTKLKKNVSALNTLHESVKNHQDMRLKVVINQHTVIVFNEKDIPSEKRISCHIPTDSSIAFIDSSGVAHAHKLDQLSGWLHLSVRVHANLGCQADCIVTNNETVRDSDYKSRDFNTVRFQAFFLAGAETDNKTLRGKGLFDKGLHYNGYVTPSNTTLSCECDDCKESFMINSFHAGFSDKTYMYSDSGTYTLSLPIQDLPSSLDAQSLADFEKCLPLAPDNSAFHHFNSFLCPHCKAPYIDFSTYPELRKKEYYGNYFVGNEPMIYNDTNNQREAS